MNTYGITIRKIRLDKGILLKELYAGIVGKDFSIKFEKGLVNLNIDHFKQVLDYLHLSFDEFFFIHNHYLLDNKETIREQFYDYINGNMEKIKSSEQFYQTYKTNHSDYIKILAYIIHINYSRFYKVDEKVLSREKKIVQDYFIQRETFTLHEIRLFSIIADIFPLNIRKILLENCLKQLTHYKNYLSESFQGEYCLLLENYILTSYLQGDIQEGNRVCLRLREEYTTVNGLYRKTRNTLCYALFLFFTNQEEESASLMQKNINGLVLLNFTELANNQEHLYKDILDKFKK